MHETYSGGRVVERSDPADRTVTTWDAYGVATSRAYTVAENAAADRMLEADAIASLEARIARVEAFLWPPADPGQPPADPGQPPPATVPTMTDYGGIWPAGQLLDDAGKVWHNVSGQPLTTSPSGFPGDPSRWTHLFVRATAVDPSEPDPDRPTGYVGPWSPAADYVVDNVVDRGGRYYRATVAHGSMYEGTWGPPMAGVWEELVV